MPRTADTERLANSERLLRHIFDGSHRSKLSPKHAAFCRAYALGFGADKKHCPTMRFSGKLAALAAGYSPRGAKQTAHKILDRPEVQAEIQALIDRTAAKQEIDAQEIVRRLDEVYARCMQAVPVLDRTGEEVGEWRFDSTGAVRSCELIGRWLRMWQAEGQINLSVTIEAARDFARGFARRVLTLIEEHVSDPDERKRLIAAIGQEALRDG